jgi:hypothetical protein
MLSYEKLLSQKVQLLCLGLFVVSLERLKRQKEEEEKRHLEEMSEDEYDALTEEEKAEVDRQRLVIKKERLRRFIFLYFCNSERSVFWLLSFLFKATVY